MLWRSVQTYALIGFTEKHYAHAASEKDTKWYNSGHCSNRENLDEMNGSTVHVRFILSRFGIIHAPVEQGSIPSRCENVS